MKRTWRRLIFLAACVLASLAAAGAASPKMPTFFARRDYSGLFTQFIQAADTNGDGIPDLIANQEGYIQVLFGNGDGTFRSGANTHAGIGGLQFVATDVNGDGKVDLVMAGQHGINGPVGIGVCLGNGDGTFQTATFYPAGGENTQTIGQAVVGDFNGDGIPDVAVAGSSGVWLFTGKGDGTFNPGVVAVALAPVQGGGLAAADFNGDHKLDLVFAMPYAGTDGSGDGFVVLLGNGNGTFQPPQAFAEPKRPINIAVAPLTKGGHPSIALSSGSDAYLYFGNGAGGFSGPRVVNLPGVNSGLAIGDVNGDGIPDLVSSGVYVAFGTGGGKFSKPYSYPIDSSGGSYNVALADLRNNGLTDIVTDAQNAISVLLSMGKGNYEDGVWTKVTGGAACGAAADFNRDGKPDLAVNTPTGVAILLGTGNAKAPFTTGATMALANTGCLLTGDLNGDGIPDLVVTTPTALVAYLGNGDGTFTQKSSTPIGPGAVVLADFNHDGKLDFATSGNLLALGNGDGTFQTPTAFVSNPPAGGFSNIAAGDINNDGWPDIVLTSLDIPNYNNLYVLLNNQKGGFTQVPTNFGESTTQAILTDLNGDGNLDLVLVYIGGATVYLGNGTGAFTYQVTLDDPIGAPAFDMVADLNGDGIPDIAVLESDTIAVYLGEGGATYATPFYIGTGPSPGMMLVENLHGQLSSAGLPDIVAPDYSGGVSILLNLTK
jgi:hypothetical protein